MKVRRYLYIFSMCSFHIIFNSCFTTDGFYSSSSSSTYTTPSPTYTSTPKPQPTFASTPKTRELILDGKKYNKEEIDGLGGITSWYCTDYFSTSTKTLLEVGYFNIGEQGLGFILFDDTNEGTERGVYHSRQGLDHRWNWGADEKGDFRYSFVIQPDGTGLYYYFLEGETTSKPRSRYKAHKR